MSSVFAFSSPWQLDRTLVSPDGDELLMLQRAWALPLRGTRRLSLPEKFLPAFWDTLKEKQGG